MIRLISVFIFLIAAGIARAADDTSFALTTSSLDRSAVSSLKFVNDSIEFKSADGKSSSLRLEEVLALDSSDSSNSSAMPDDVWIAMLVDGSRVGGVPLRLEGDQLRWRFQTGEIAADLTFDLAKITTISRLSSLADQSDDSVTQDCLRLKNGDVVRGIIDDITETTISIQSDGKRFDANRDDVALLRLANVPTDPDSIDTSYIIRLSDPGRSVFRASKLEGTDQGLMMTIGDQTIKLDAGLIASLRNTNGRAQFLVDLKPKSVEVSGYFASEGQTPKFDVAPARSIQTRSRTRIAYDVSDYKTMQTRFEIPPGLDHANVTVRIQLDGKTAFERANVTSGKTSELISLDLNGSKEMTLETDFGENFDVQDRLIWLEPVLAR